MNFEEFNESDVIFDDYCYSSDDQSSNEEEEDSGTIQLSDHGMVKRRNQVQIQRVSSSMPVNIPGNGSFRYNVHVVGREPFDNCDDFDYDDDDEEMIMRFPPHVIVERRENNGEEMAKSFSPLKGKNLCQVRNSILRMTGFLER